MGPERPSSSDFGAKLRAARERKGVSLRQIATATKISIAALEALERNDISRLPGGIFSRAFVRSYASEVGLDPEATIQDFIAQFPQDTVTAGHPTSDQVFDNETFESDRRISTTFLGLLVICVPLAGAVVYFSTAGRRASSPAAVTAVTPPPAPAPSVSSSAPPETPVAAPPAVVPSQPAVSPAVATPAPEESFTVGLSVKRPCWVSAMVDGHIAIERLLEPGDLRKIEVRREMVLTAGDASAVTLTLNGAEARSLGKTGEVVTTRLNLTNFKGYVQSR